MKTRLLISITVCMLAGQFLMNAQENRQGPAKEKPSMEEMVQRKADRMAMEMSLDDKTADKFRETYKEYLGEKAAARGNGCDKGCMKESQEGRLKGKPAYISDAEVEKAIESRFDKRQKMLDRDQKILDIDMKYYTKFKKFLTPKQVIKIYELERKPGQRPDRKPDARPHGRPADRNNRAK